MDHQLLKPPSTAANRGNTFDRTTEQSIQIEQANSPPGKKLQLKGIVRVALLERLNLLAEQDELADLAGNDVFVEQLAEDDAITPSELAEQEPPISEGRQELLVPEMVAREQRNDRYCKAMMSYLEKGELPDDDQLATNIRHFAKQYEMRGEMLFHLGKRKNKPLPLLQLVVPETMRAGIIRDAHWPAHLGVYKTLNRISLLYFWPNLETEIARFCRNCLECAKHRHPQRYLAPLPKPIHVPPRPFMRLSLDTAGPFAPSSSGMTALVIFADSYSKWIEVNSTDCS
jgi:hypothetical protein